MIFWAGIASSPNGHYGTRQDVVFFINGIPVLVTECKNATKDEGIALGIDQIRRYHDETPELFVPQQLFTATDVIGFSYGVTWNTVRRNIFAWKAEDFEPQISQMGTDKSSESEDLCKSVSSVVKSPLLGNLEFKVKTFCAIPRVLAFLNEYILFAEKDEELQKYILRQHQTDGVRRWWRGRWMEIAGAGWCGTRRAAARRSR